MQIVKTKKAIELSRGDKGSTIVYDGYKFLYNPVTDKAVSMCRIEGCTNISNDGVLGYKCKKHSGYEKQCEFEDCIIKPTFGPVNGKCCRCFKHKNPGDIDLMHKHCEATGCIIRATHGEVGGKPVRCATHQHRPTDVDLVNKHCLVDGCGKLCHFGYIDSSPFWCSEHAPVGCINLGKKICSKPGCTNYALFGLPESLPSRCSIHAPPNYVNIYAKMCIDEECTSRAHRGPLFETAKHCGRHSTNNEFLHRYPRCSAQNCRDPPFYTNNQSGYPQRCELHKQPDDVNIVERPCSKCGLSYFIPTNRTECNDCWVFFTVLLKNRKSKELRVKDLLDTNQITYQYTDSIIPEGCSKYRPDFTIIKGTYVIILECDEYQHAGYLLECEMNRMKSIYFDFGGLNVIFVRYNPDKYVDYFGNTVRDTRDRENFLIQYLKSFDHVTQLVNPCSVTHLFYNGWTGTPVVNQIYPYSPSVVVTKDQEEKYQEMLQQGARDRDNDEDEDFVEDDNQEVKTMPQHNGQQPLLVKQVYVPRVYRLTTRLTLPVV